MQKSISEMTTRDRLITVFAAAFELPENSELVKAEYGRTVGWDSMAHMRLITELENSFDVMLDTHEVIGLSSFQKALEILEKHGVSSAA